MQAACQKQVTPHHSLKRLILICACKVRFSQRMLSSSIYVWVYLGFCPWSSSSWNHPKNPNIDQEIDGTDHMHTAKKNTHYLRGNTTPKSPKCVWLGSTLCASVCFQPGRVIFGSHLPPFFWQPGTHMWSYVKASECVLVVRKYLHACVLPDMLCT